MTLGLATRRRAGRKWAALGSIVVVSTLLGASAALAVVPPSTFEGGDGNFAVDTTGNTDWVSIKANVNVGIDLPSGKTDNSLGQGTKEDDPNVTVVNGSIPPNKNDLTRFYEYSEHVGTDDFLYLGWERAVNIGNANLDFEINKNKVQPDMTTAGAKTLARTAGDLLVTYDFSGSGTPTIGILRWLTSTSVPVVPGFATNACFSANTFPCWGDRKVLDATDSEGAVNTSSVVDPIDPNAPRTLGVGLFGETAIDLTKSGVFTPGQCESFGSTYLKSRSSSSFTAEVKDFVAPVPVAISNCGEVIIKKVTTPAEDTNSFQFTTTNSLASNFDLTGVSTGDPAPNTKDIKDVPAGSYTVSESAETGWTLDSISCSQTGGATINGTTKPTADFTVVPNSVVTCTFNNSKNKSNPDATTAPSYIPQDSATVSGFETNAGTKGKIHFELWSTSTCDTTGSPAGVKLYDEQQTVDSNKTYTTTNPGGSTVSGRTISTDGTVYWKVYYDGDTRNNTFDKGCTESIQANITP